MTTPHTTLTPLDAVQALYDAFGRGDMDGLLELVDPDVDWGADVAAPDAELVPMLRRGRGLDTVRRYFAGVAQLEFHRFEPRRFLVDGDHVYVEIEVDVEHPATAKRAVIGEIHCWVVDGGRVTRYRNFLDTATLIELFRP